MHLLLIEDDLELGPALLKALRKAHFTAEWLRTCHDARAFAARERYDCMLLDLSLPDGQGIDLLQHWRSQGISTPVIVITARSGLDDRLAGLDGGADDYIVKPFAFEELVSRIHAVTRRAARQAASEWRFGELVIDVARHEVRQQGAPITLTPAEYDILLALARASGTVVSKHQLVRALDPREESIDFNTIEVHVHHLRRKLGAEQIRTIRGVGYFLAQPAESSR